MTCQFIVNHKPSDDSVVYLGELKRGNSSKHTGEQASIGGTFYEEDNREEASSAAAEFRRPQGALPPLQGR